MSFEASLLLPVIILMLLTVAFCQQKIDQRLALRQIRRQIQRAEIQRSEQRLYALCVEQLEKTQALLESGIDETTAGVRALHQEIANIPFSVLESIPVTRDTTKVVRGIHDLISNGVYSAISVGNQMAGSASRSGIKNAADRKSSRAERLALENKDESSSDDSDSKN